MTTDPTTGPSRRRFFPAAAAVAMLAGLPASAGLAQAPDTPAGIVAAQLRSQGYVCTQPVSAVRDRRASRPNATVWMLRCRNARYRVLLVPDMAAEVTRIE